MTDDETRRTDLTGTGDTPAGSTEPPVSTGATEPAPATTPAGFEAAPPAVGSGGSNRTRWVIGLGVAGLAIVIAIGAFLLLGARPTPEALRYVTGDSALVAEVRLDLPGDQMQKVGNLLAHFPGFQDQSILRDKIDESLSRLLADVSDAEVDYRTDVKPWINGPAFIGLAAPPAGSTDVNDSVPLISATTNGAVDCVAALGDAVTHETYRGLDLVIDTAEFGLACVVDGRQALLGPPATVRSALDAKADGTGMDKNERYRAARAALGGDQLATVFLNGADFADLIPMPSFGDVPVPGLGGLGGLAGGALPEWVMAGIRAEDDALVLDTVAAPVPAPTSGPSLVPLPATHPSVLAGMVPADTLLLIEDQGTGVTVQNLLTTLRADPNLGAALGMLDGMGGPGELVGWIEDAGVAVVGGPDTPSVGVLLLAIDDAAAASRVTTLNNLLALAGIGGGIEIRETTVAGVQVTTVVITDLGALIPPGTLPGDVEPPAGGTVEFSIAAKDRAILVGIGEGFMTGLLNVQPGSSLADQAGYQHATRRGLASSRTSVYAGVPAALDLLEGFLPEEIRSQWESDILPYLEPLEAVSISISGDAAASRSRFVVTVKQP
jgi:hypothetical protein